MNIAKFVAQNAQRAPQQEAICFDGKTYTYSDLDIISARIAAGLRRSGVKRGDRLALYLPNCPEFIFGYLAAARLGAITVSLNYQLARNEVQHILSDCGASVILTDRNRLREVPTEISTLNEIILCDSDINGANTLSTWIQNPDSTFEIATVTEADSLAVLYTSGTTGLSKGAVLTHGNVKFTAESAIDCCQTSPDDRLLLMVPVSHCFGQNMVMNHAFKGSATIVLLQTFDPSHLLETIERNQVTMFFAVPAVYALLLQSEVPATRLKSVRYYHSGGSPLSPTIMDKWLARYKSNIHQGYGLTESSPLACYNQLPQLWPNSVGKPIQQVKIRVVDEAAIDVPTGKIGEILIQGPNVMKEYWNNPEATALTIRDNWLYTGDLGLQDCNGNFYIVDRVKDMINVSGLKVFPTEVEQILETHLAIREAGVFGVPDPILGERVQAQVILQEGQSVDLLEVIKFCRARMAPFKVPETIKIVNRLPRNSAGKLLRRALTESALLQLEVPEK